jgi:hypothetical protein
MATGDMDRQRCFGFGHVENAGDWRLSTELQRYSTQNLVAAIAAYAQQQNLTLVRTYADLGRSGVRINRRPGLAELIRDVESGNADFDRVLVYDISRWGRFQDVDESAHYEFVCKRKGVKVAYCAEQFENDGSLLSSIIKNIKRVMAVKFSREPGVKMHTGHCQMAGLGYRVGGPLTFGLGRGNSFGDGHCVPPMIDAIPLWANHRPARPKLRIDACHSVVQAPHLPPLHRSYPPFPPATK